MSDSSRRWELCAALELIQEEIEALRSEYMACNISRVPIMEEIESLLEAKAQVVDFLQNISAHTCAREERSVS